MRPTVVGVSGIILGLAVVGITTTLVQRLAPPEAVPVRAGSPAAGHSAMVMDEKPAAVVNSPVQAHPENAPATDPSRTSVSHLDELIAARQLVMDSNESAMMAIETGKDLSLPLLQGQAYQIYTILTAFPHLFPAESKPAPSPDGGAQPSTAAAPRIWTEFDTFYAQSMTAADLAFKTSQAPDKASLATLGKDLRAACEACHATYMHVVDPAP